MTPYRTLSEIIAGIRGELPEAPPAATSRIQTPREHDITRLRDKDMAAEAHKQAAEDRRTAQADRVANMMMRASQSPKTVKRRFPGSVLKDFQAITRSRR